MFPCCLSLVTLPKAMLPLTDGMDKAIFGLLFIVDSHLNDYKKKPLFVLATIHNRILGMIHSLGLTADSIWSERCQK